MLKKMGNGVKGFLQFFASPRFARTLVVLAILIFVTTLGIAYWKSTVQNQPQQSKPGTKKYQQTRLTLQPEKLVISSNSASETQTIAVKINANTNKVTGVQLEIGYNTKVLSDVEVTPGTFFNKPVVLLKKINTEKGQISYIIGDPPNSSGHSGKGVVAYIKFKAKPNENKRSKVRFRRNTIATAVGYKDNVLKKTDGTTIVFK